MRPDGLGQNGAFHRAREGAWRRDRVVRFHADLPRHGDRHGEAHARGDGRRPAPSARFSRALGGLQRRRLYAARRRGGSRDRIARAYTAARRRHRAVCPRAAARHVLSRGELRRGGACRLVRRVCCGRHRAALRAPADARPRSCGADSPEQHEARDSRARILHHDRRPVFRAGKGLPNGGFALRLQDALPLLPRPRGTVRAHQPPRRSDARGRASRGGAPVFRAVRHKRRHLGAGHRLQGAAPVF